jgi:P pilus assembly chaperone PapD
MILFMAGSSFAGLMIVPQRIVMDTKTRSTVVLLMNTDSTPHTYRLGWKMMTMDEAGKYHPVPIDEKDPHALPNMIVFSPRQITLAGNGRQNVRLSLRLPSDLPAGEYRAHLQFNAMPDEEPGQDEKKEKGVSFGLRFLVGTSIPVIVRTGGATGEVKISAASLQAASDGQPPALHLELAHTAGANSVYGRLLVFLQKDQIGIVNNVALYPEQAKRGLTISLTTPPPPGSTVRIVYEGAGEYAGKTLAEQSLTITK